MRERAAKRRKGEGLTGYDQSTLAKAKQLRREMTDAERKLWSVLRNSQLGAKFRRQQPIGPYIADLVCQEARLIVEADGGQHADALSDARRTAFLQSKGYRVLRFWNNDVLQNLEGVAEAILAALLTPHPAQPAAESPSPSRGEGICDGALHG
ncbi:MAG TPA: endonuclease domain-containing protein [Sphingomicrobium sp.]|nr:endonuclease domain-containing protein [Sphingomicrobium sp.]